MERKYRCYNTVGLELSKDICIVPNMICIPFDIYDLSNDLLVSLLDLQRFLSGLLFHSCHSLADGLKQMWVVTIVSFLLVYDFLEFVEKRVVEVSFVFGQGNEQSDCLFQIQVTIDLLLI